jgi:hypothetical protein
LGVKRPGREADHSSLSTAEVKNEWSYTSITQYVFMAWCLVKHRDTLLYWCETWSLTFREEHRLRVSENRVLRKIFGPKREKDEYRGENCIMMNFIACIFLRILLG